MGDKDLEKVLSSISTAERKTAVKQVQIDRLQEAFSKQKKVIDELQGIIDEQKKKIDAMYDVPADIEELKRLIGAQRADLNDKDQKLELSYSKIAQLEQELKGTNQTQNIMNQKFDDTFSQIGTIKAELAEKKAALQIKENDMKHLEIKISELQKVIDQNQKAMTDHSAAIRAKDMELIEEKSKIESKLKGEIYSQRDEAFKKIKELESKLFEQELSTKTELAEARKNASAYSEMKVKYEELLAKYDAVAEKEIKMNEREKNFEKGSTSLREFQKNNQKLVTVFEKLKNIMEKEPKFQIFCIVWDVGETPISDLKNAVGVPTVTIKKYIQNYVDEGIFKVSDDDKVSFVDE
ncbi:MAG: hypothetical protein GY870_22200 [archaeon]|nr:hypothetical protein [archaeon]